MAVLSVLISSLALAASVVAHPQVGFGSAKGVVAGQCSGQSCLAADVAGITGKAPSGKPEGGSAAGWKCVAKYNPDAAGASSAPKSGGLFGKLGKGKGNFVVTEQIGAEPVKRSTTEVEAEAEVEDDIEYIEVSSVSELEKRQLGKGSFSGACKANILIFAKGTTEIGDMGSTVGPALRTALSTQGGGQWTVVGVRYNADIAGDNCVGLPGGMIAKDMVESAAQKCPNAKIFTSGYSQGAMVARIAVAYASSSARQRVKGIVVYGDPFNGAKIKGWDGPIKTFCRNGDAVCTGAFKIGAAHLSYAASSDVTQGARWLVSTARGS